MITFFKIYILRITKLKKCQNIIYENNKFKNLEKIINLITQVKNIFLINNPKFNII